MAVIIIHDKKSAENLYHSFKKDREKRGLKLKSWSRDIFDEVIDWLYDNDYQIMKASK